MLSPAALPTVWAGNFSVTEVKAILTDLEEQADAAKTYKRLAIALFFLMLVFLCAIMGQCLSVLCMIDLPGVLARADQAHPGPLKAHWQAARALN